MKKHLLLVASALFCGNVFSQSPRMVLYEEFTGESCYYCGVYNPALNQLLNQPVNQARMAAIKWQVPIPSVPTATWSLYQTNKGEINWRYRSTAQGGYGYAISSAPAGKINGKDCSVYGASSNHPANLNNNVITSAAAVPAPFTINMVREWNFDASAINLTITVTASQNFNATGNLVFRTVMIERQITFSVAPGTNGEKHFEDAAIRSYPTIQGGTSLPSSWTNGQSQTFTLNCVIPTYARKKNELAFVGFIQDDGTKEVHQAYRLDKEGFPYDISAKTPVLEPVCSAQMNPVIVLENKGVNPITAMTITPYTDGNAQNITTWTGNLAPGNTETVIMTSFNTPASDGAHTFSYTVTELNGIDVETSNNGSSVAFVVANQYATSSVQEGFAGSFPPNNWTVIDAVSGKTWDKTNAAGGYGLSFESVMVPFFNNSNIGEIEELVLPPANLKGSAVPTLEFLYAYAKSTGTSNDRLEVLVSNDCGANWTTVFDRSGDVLKSVTDPIPSAFVPQGSEWRPEVINLTNFNSESVIVKFRATNDHGNNLYLDDVNMKQSLPTGISQQKFEELTTSLFPNPSNGMVTLSIGSPNSGTAKVLVTNNIGQVIQERHIAVAAGRNNYLIDLSGQAKGLYHVTLTVGSTITNTKLTITE